MKNLDGLCNDSEKLVGQEFFVKLGSGVEGGALHPLFGGHAHKNHQNNNIILYQFSELLFIISYSPNLEWTFLLDFKDDALINE